MRNIKHGVVAALGLAIVITVTAVSASTASAADGWEYWNALVSPGLYEPVGFSGNNHSAHLDYKYVHYDGTGTVNVCEYLASQTYGEIEEKCANQNIISSYRPLWGADLYALVKNNSSYTHTIKGQITEN